MIAVCLLTCDRFAYTATTLRSFAAFNDPSRFVLLHADDASEDSRVVPLVQTHGFSTVLQSSSRRGWLTMRTRLFQLAAKRGAEWILFLENDHEWVRAFPWALFHFVRQYSQIYCLRLQGAFKGRDRTDPCMVHHKLDRRKEVKWKPMKRAPETSEIGRIHWSAQPSVTRTRELLVLHERGFESHDLTARVLSNVTYHIGARRTPAIEVPA